MKRFLTFMTLLGFLTYCSEPKQKIVYDNSTDTVETVNQILADTTTLTVAGLPIHFDSTNIIIHPIGQYKPEKRTSKLNISSYSGASGLAFAYMDQFTVSGNLDNLKFQKIDSENLTILTNNKIKINSFTFLYSIFVSLKKQLIVYRIKDKDTNKDKKLDHNDIESLYISNIDGQNFKKLSPEFQELVDWKVIDILKRIYFTTIEDINKNGEFEKADRMHYFYLDISESNNEVVEYNPIE